MLVGRVATQLDRPVQSRDPPPRQSPALPPKCLLETYGWRDGFVASLRSSSGCSRSACRPLVWLSNEVFPAAISPWCGSREERARTSASRSAHHGSHQRVEPEGGLMNVIIGIDPHKATHHAVAVERRRGRTRAGVGAGVSNPDSTVDVVGGTVPVADVGDRGRRRARLSVVPAARRCRRTRC